MLVIIAKKEKGEIEMLSNILEELGFECKKETSNAKKYISPFRPNEKTASFYVLKTKDGFTNFKDYGDADKKGDIYKFIMQYYNIPFVEAKKLLQAKNFVKAKQPLTSTSFSLKQQKKNYKIIRVQSLQSVALKNYLKSRKIFNNYNQLLELIYENSEGNKYFGIAFKNRSGGYEFRNKYSKRSFLNKDFTLVRNYFDRLKIFEGFMDYLSYLELTKAPPIFDYIILNSTSTREDVLKFIKDKYITVDLYLDNDKSGDETTKFFLDNLEKAFDKRRFYLDFKDVNEFLMSN